MHHESSMPVSHAGQVNYSLAHLQHFHLNGPLVTVTGHNFTREKCALDRCSLVAMQRKAKERKEERRERKSKMAKYLLPFLLVFSLEQIIHFGRKCISSHTSRYTSSHKCQCAKYLF